MLLKKVCRALIELFLSLLVVPFDEKVACLSDLYPLYVAACFFARQTQLYFCLIKPNPFLPGLLFQKRGLEDSRNN